ncbi:MAG: rRNA maturation RNase YbeY [Bacteriovorax sp.]|jgi:probable rRNA maturation factor
MKLTISHLDTGINSGIKKKTSKGMAREIIALEKTFAAFLTRNPHFNGVNIVTISMTLCGRTKIKTLNRKYRHKDYVTDVLSFPVYENLRPDKRSKGKNLPEMELGDLIICKERAKSQAREFKITFEQEIVHLAVHGFLHLLGFDHEISGREEKIMEKYETELVDAVYKKLSVKK